MTTPLRFLTYADLQETVGSAGCEMRVSLALTIQNEAIAEYRSKNGRYSAKGVDKMENEIQGRMVSLVNVFLSETYTLGIVADMVVNHRQYVVLAWAIAQKLKGTR